MELEELKNIWKNTTPNFQSKGESEIALMLKKQSQSIVGKIKRNVWFELIFTIVGGFALLVYVFTLPSGALKWFFVSALILLVVYLFYYAKKIMMLNRYNKLHVNMKLNLEILINNLSGYLKFYKRSYAILYPVYFCLMLIFIGLERGTDEFVQAISRPEKILLLVFLAVFFFICSRWLTKWYLRKLYGNHLEKLKSLLNDLE
ncbi:MAG TPA: hypothetical protein PKU83_06210, partial [Chryseolinea sp.]|nr:hypothetical protein [Chryseolinea sp.]